MKKRLNAAQSGPGHNFRNEEGFLLLGVLFMVLLITITLAVAAPKIAESIRRDKEEETIHRGKQYARAIHMYYAKYGRYPNSIDQLMKTNNVRFLRKRYKDPMTGKDDWRIIHLGEATVPAVGLFGQTIQSGITPTGMTNGAGGVSTNSFGSSSSFGSTGSSLGGGSSAFGSPGSSGNNNGSSFGSSSSSFGNSGSTFGSSGSSTATTGGINASSASGTDSGSGASSGTGFGSSSGSGFGSTTGSGVGSSTGSGFGSSPGIGGTVTTGGLGSTNANGTTGGGSAFGTPGATFGGAPIMGVGLLSKKESIKVFRKQNHYNKWEFVYDYTQSALEATAGAPTNINGSMTGTSATGTTGTGFGSSNGTGFGSSNGSGFGSSNGSGFGSSSGSGFGSSSGSGFGSSSGFGSNNGTGSGSNNGLGFGGSPTSPVSPTAPVNNSPQ
jgi:type II secretory pathway pseudopilin PulG